MEIPKPMEKRNRLLKILFAAFSGALAFVVAITLSGCNFFGKQVENTSTTPVGTLGNGVSVLGTWASSGSTTSSSNNPSLAITTSFTFEPTGVARVESQEMHSSGALCVGYGQYRTLGNNDIIIYLQATSSSACLFSSQIHLSQVSVSGGVLRFSDGSETYSYFQSRPQVTAPVGVWDFESAGGTNGENGIDYLFFDAHGYFVMQTTSGIQRYLLMGYYTTTSSGSITLTFFSDMDPANVDGAPLVFDEYVMNGAILQLIQITDQGAFAYTGNRL